MEHIRCFSKTQFLGYFHLKETEFTPSGLALRCKAKHNKRGQPAPPQESCPDPDRNMGEWSKSLEAQPRAKGRPAERSKAAANHPSSHSLDTAGPL